MAGLKLSYHEKAPSLLPAYWRMLTGRKRKRLSEGATIPLLEASITNLDVDEAALEAYRHVCGFASDGTLPFSFPHVMASPLFMQLVSAKEFPLKAMGLVHTSVSMDVHRTILESESLDIVARIDGHREANRGVEFDIVLSATSAGKVVWDSTSTYIAIGKKKKSKGKAKSAAKDGDTQDSTFEEISVAEDTGRRYAKASSDYNPIHLRPYTAKLLGFPQHIAHGMWTFAKAGAMLGKIDAPYRISGKFIGPIFLPAKVFLMTQPSDTSFKVVASAKKDAKPHLIGSVTPLD